MKMLILTQISFSRHTQLNPSLFFVGKEKKGGAVNIVYGNIVNGNIEFILTSKTVTSNLTSNFLKQQEHQEEGSIAVKLLGTCVGNLETYFFKCASITVCWERNVT